MAFDIPPPESCANRVIDCCGSTNDVARALGERGYPHLTWVAAREQDSGRGRLGRKWESMEGNLFLSVVVRIEDKSRWTWVPLAAAIAVAHGISQFADARIKWPNDIWVGGAKLGGILCEGVGSREGSFIIIGIGLNCATAPEGLDQKTVSLSDAAGLKVSAEDVRAPILAALERTLADLVENGAQAIRHAYEARAALTPGLAIEWGSGSGAVEGLGASGELVVVDENGSRVRLLAEDVKVRVVRKAADGSLL